MDENSYLGSSESSDVDNNSFSMQRKYLPSFDLLEDEASKLSLESIDLSSESNTKNNSSNQSFSLPVDYQETKSEQKEFRRSSLYRQFDPLHSSQQILVSFDKQDYKTSNKASKMQKPFIDSFIGEIEKDTVASNMSNFSSENVLISFESPKKSEFPQTFNDKTVSMKKYTDKEFKRILQEHELHLQGEFLRKHHGLETSFTEKDNTLEHELSRISKINNLHLIIVSEMTDILQNIVSYSNELQDKIKSMEIENENLKKDIATSKEDLFEWESTFSEIHKRYEQCKSMLNCYKENEELLQRSVENLRLSMDDKDNMFNLLEPKAQEIMDEAQKEIESAKKYANGQVAKLGAQLKKAEMKIYSLENDFKQTKIQNDEMTIICNELMSKIGK